MFLSIVTFTIRYRHGNLHSYGLLAFYFIIFHFFVQGEIDDFSGISYNFSFICCLCRLKYNLCYRYSHTLNHADHLTHHPAPGLTDPPAAPWRLAPPPACWSGLPPRSVLTLDAHEDYSGVLLGKFFWSDPVFLFCQKLHLQAECQIFRFIRIFQVLDLSFRCLAHAVKKHNRRCGLSIHRPHHM